MATEEASGGVVERLTLAPVKGMRLLAPEQIEVRRSGATHDRRFFLIDDAGKMLGAFVPRLSAVSARWDEGSHFLEMHLPDDTIISAPIELDGRPEARAWDGRPVPGRLVTGPWSPALSDYLRKPVRLVAAVEEGAGIDVQPITLVSLASVRRLAEELKVRDVDPDRFRATVLIDGVEAHEEDEWYGRDLSIGDTAVRITGPIPRCVAVTRGPATGEKDLRTLHAIKQYRDSIPGGPAGRADIPFGVYGLVSRPGRIRIGDRVRVDSKS